MQGGLPCDFNNLDHIWTKETENHLMNQVNIFLLNANALGRIGPAQSDFVDGCHGD
jgi:hypothetical protein